MRYAASRHLSATQPNETLCVEVLSVATQLAFVMQSTNPQVCKRFDVVVVGSGAAGLTLALRLARSGRRIAVISKGALAEGSTLYAQGGISAVLDAGDSVEAHVSDQLPYAINLFCTTGIELDSMHVVTKSTGVCPMIW